VNHVKSRRFDKVAYDMHRMKKQWLESDNDATLTVKSMKMFDDLIKLGSHSVEQQLLMKQINQHLWNDIHDIKERVFNMAVSCGYQSDGSAGK